MSDQKSEDRTRRQFVQTGAAGVGLGMVSGTLSARPAETLAINGGPKSVTYPDDKHTELTKWPRYGPAEKQALHAVIDANTFYDELPAFEKDWQAYTKSPFVKAHMNGSSAITSMYFALDLPPGSEILVPSYDFFSDCLAMRFFGCVPTFVDIDPKTACFDLDDAKRKLTRNTRALVPMHAWGLPCEMDHLKSFADEKGLVLLEDAAHAHGASMQGRKMGTWGRMGIYSFQASKPLPGIEGGMGMYQNRSDYERATAFGHYEAPATFPADSPVRAYEGTGFGQKYRMHPLSAAILRSQLKGLDERNAVVAKNVRALNDRLVHLPGISEPRCRPDQDRGYYWASMMFFDASKAGFKRDVMLKAILTEGVPIKTWVYPEQHKLKIYSEAKWWHHKPAIAGSFAGNDQVNSTHFFLPLLHGEVPDLIDQYVQAFEKVWAHRADLAKA